MNSSIHVHVANIRKLHQQTSGWKFSPKVFHEGFSGKKGMFVVNYS